MIIQQLYDALIAAGAPEDKARDAARAVAGYDTRLNQVERELSVLKWMVGFALAVGLGNLWVSFTILSQLP